MPQLSICINETKAFRLLAMRVPRLLATGFLVFLDADDRLLSQALKTKALM
jgi:hypothetical protein